jgi:xanthine dehydrogenase accessory factor
LREAGCDESAINRIRGPVGVASGARTPTEIAISIMAEITAVLRRAPLAQRV